MSIKNRLIKEYLEQSQSHVKVKHQSRSSLNKYDYKNDPVLASLRNRCSELVTNGFVDAARRHLLNYIIENYPDKVDLERVWIDNLNN